MNHRSRLVGALAAIAAIATLGSAMPASASPAPTSVVACAVPIVGPPTDTVRISLVNFDFGDGGLDGNEPASCGELTWDLANGTITPRLAGTLYAKNAIGTSVRMRLRHRDVDGTLLATTTGATKSVTSNDVAEFPIDLGNDSNPLAYQVDVELQQLIANVWTTQGSQTVHLGSAAKAPDGVLITGVGQDFGGPPFANGVPGAPGTLTWDLSGGTITPQLTGELYMINSAGTRARLRVRHYDVHDNLLISAAGGTHEPPTNALTTFPINLANYSNPEIHHVEVAITIDVGGTWTVVGTPVVVTI